jgi:hypothetical protein
MARASDQSKTGFVTVATVRNRGEAQSIAAKLKGAGIESLVSMERVAQFPAPGSRWLGGTKVQVSRADVDRAVQVLQRARAGVMAQQAVGTNRSRAPRWRFDLDGWRGAVLAALAMIAVASLLALWLF